MATSKQKEFSFIERRAINPGGHLGSAYDAFRDQVLDRCNVHLLEQHRSISLPPKCELLTGANPATNNLLEWMGIEIELRLGLLLKPLSRFGIAKVLLHPHPIDGNTRFLYYSRMTGKAELKEKGELIKALLKVWKIHSDATHIINSITYGIDAIIVLQLSSQTGDIEEIDQNLQMACSALRKKGQTSTLKAIGSRLQGKILHTTIYSNTPTLIITDISDVLYKLDSFQVSMNKYYPLIYSLQLITTLYSDNTKKSHRQTNPLFFQKIERFRPLPSSLINKIELYILGCRNSLQHLETSLKEIVPRSLCGYHGQRMGNAQKQCSEVKDKYTTMTRQLQKLIVDARKSESVAVQAINKQLSTDRQTQDLNNDTNDLVRIATSLETKGRLITNLRNEQFEYIDASRFKFHSKQDLTEIKTIVISKYPHHGILCSTDDLNQASPSKFIEQRRKLVEKHQDNKQLLVYLDFSDSLFSLPDMIVWSTNDHRHDDPRPPPVKSPPSSSIDEFINLLLLGETGVGKSTFINAFANYLTFNSLEQAQSNEPIVIIPTSFILTVGNDFEEHTVNFGEFDSSNNEHFNNIGQSVTQYCRSYVFDLKENGKKLRIIDTPGFGDTRGLEQDDRNMEHVLQYINNLSHLNAICFLLKPNSSRLNISFRTCLMQLFSFLAPTARQNIIFCFTNSRSTFYTPGDTAPLLKATLVESSMKDIPFQKENTFCFDSESFRYLVALRNDITFTEDDQREYGVSWSTSMKESHRLINYIEKNRLMYNLNNGWQSIKHAQLQISQLIRPLLEAIRNNLRNIILYERNSKNEFIEIYSNSLQHPAAYCLSCRKDLHPIGQFWVVSDDPHEMQTSCSSCTCTADQHVSIHYILKHRPAKNPSKYDPRKMTAEINGMCQACARFAHFLTDVVGSTKGDPFLDGIGKMIDEENYICQVEKSASLNVLLLRELGRVGTYYEKCKNEMKINTQSKLLPGIYDLMKMVTNYPSVYEQMLAVKQSEQNLMKQHEHEPHQI